MQRKNDSTILILVAAGLGIYWYMKNKSNTSQVNPADQSTGGGVGIEQQPEGVLDAEIDKGFALRSPPNPSGGGGSVVDRILNTFEDTRYVDNDRLKLK